MDDARHLESLRGQAAVDASPVSQQRAGATATIAPTTSAERNQKDVGFVPQQQQPPSSALAPPCLAAVRAHSAALAAEEAERAASLAADAARWDPEAWAATADKVLLPFVQPRGRGVVERALAPRDHEGGAAGATAAAAAPPSPPLPPPPPPPSIASVGDVVIVAAEIPDDLSVLRIAPGRRGGEVGGVGEEASTSAVGDGGDDDGTKVVAAAERGGAGDKTPAPSTEKATAETFPPTRCWVGTVRQLEAASGRALLGWLVPKRTSTTWARGGVGGNASTPPDAPASADPAPGGTAATAATTGGAASENEVDGQKSDNSGRAERSEREEREQPEDEDFSASAWMPAPGLAADWLDATSPGILSVCRSLERGTARIPARALSAASGRLAALVAHDVARAEREKRREGGGEGGSRKE